jgi:uncharacterized protein YkwD
MESVRLPPPHGAAAFPGAISDPPRKEQKMPAQLIRTITVSLLLLGATVALAASSTETKADPALDSEEQLFLQLINQYRQDNGAVALVIDSSLANASDWMSADMGQNNYFSHTDSLGRDPFKRMCDFGYCYNTWKGENIAAGTGSAQTVFNHWKGSTGHNANMLNSNYRVIGIARVYTSGSAYGWYWTTDFGGYIAPPQSSDTPTPSPSPSATPTPAATSTPTPAATPTATPALAPTPTPTLAPTPTPTPTATPAATPSPSPAPGPGDSDGDGFADSAEQAIGTNHAAACGDFDTSKPGYPSRNWPADLVSIDASANKVDIQDALSFLGPVRRLGASPGDPGYDPRWDIAPGPNGPFDGYISLIDLTSLIALKPPMFAGERAFGGPICN